MSISPDFLTPVSCLFATACQGAHSDELGQLFVMLSQQTDARKTQNHKTVWIEVTFKGHLVQPPCLDQGHIQLDEVFQNPIQPDLEFFQGCGIYHLYGRSVAVFQHPLCNKKEKKNLPYIWSETTLF